MLERIDVAMLPAEAEALEAGAYLVVDVLRATTTIAAMFGAGLRSLNLAASIDVAREMASRDGRLLFGEVGGLPPAGFDYGNSPIDAARAPIQGKDAVLFTTNGTTALCKLAGRGAVLAAAAANATAVARHAAETYESVAVVCAGEEGGLRFALEDFAAAGIIVAALSALAPAAALGDAAALARHTPELDQLIGLSRHARLLRELGLGDDVAFSARVDTSRAVPIVMACGDGWAVLEDLAK
ncbi:MAG: 2-phosphosulfolactate phosphatase [Chloroflexi bacterium]|nr:2-phosphosulfolactate phosphatase [Chloroflexota bacterium]